MNKTATDSDEVSLAHQITRHLAAGADGILSLSVSGSLLMALSYLTDVYAINPANLGNNTPVAQFFHELGTVSFGLVLPLWSGFIAKSVAGEAGFVAGLLGGALAVSSGSGFWMAMASGFIAGYSVNYAKKNFARCPKTWRECKTTIIYPVFALIVTGYIALFVLAPPAASLYNWLPDNLSVPIGNSATLTGMLSGGLSALDLNGPLARGAWYTGANLIGDGEHHVMARVMAGEMVPPLIIAFAATWRKNCFTTKESGAAKCNYFIGLTGVLEGVFPFAARDPWRIIPACALGAATAGALTAIFDCTMNISAGGIFALAAVNSPVLFMLSVLVGAVVGAILLIWLKPAHDGRSLDTI